MLWSIPVTVPPPPAGSVDYRRNAMVGQFWMPLGEARLRRPVSPQPRLAVRRCKTRRFEGGRRFLAAAAPELDGPGRPVRGCLGGDFGVIPLIINSLCTISLIPYRGIGGNFFFIYFLPAGTDLGGRPRRLGSLDRSLPS